MAEVYNTGNIVKIKLSKLQSLITGFTIADLSRLPRGIPIKDGRVIAIRPADQPDTIVLFYFIGNRMKETEVSLQELSKWKREVLETEKKD